MEIPNLDAYPIEKTMAYGGAEGRKQALIIDGELWMVKYPESTKDFRGKRRHLPSYTTSPLSEYIGSKVYETLGIPVHETFLGIREGKLVVACKDFASGGRIIDFASIKNTVSEDALSHGTSSSPRGDYLSDVLRVIEEAEIFDGIREEVRRRFWDMFVTDAFILNNDRNNGNWGLLPIGSRVKLAPVYDNGQSFFNKKSNSLMQAQLEEEGAVWNNVSTSVSFYRADDGHAIRPFAFLGTTQDENAREALARFVGKVDIDAVKELIEEIPEMAGGIDVLPAPAREFYERAAEESLEKGMLPAARAQGLA